MLNKILSNRTEIKLQIALSNKGTSKPELSNLGKKAQTKLDKTKSFLYSKDGSQI